MKRSFVSLVEMTSQNSLESIRCTIHRGEYQAQFLVSQYDIGEQDIIDPNERLEIAKLTIFKLEIMLRFS